MCHFNLLRSIIITAKHYLYMKLILPLLDYCCYVFDSHFKKYNKNLQTVQKLLTELSLAICNGTLPNVSSYLIIDLFHLTSTGCFNWQLTL